MVWIVTTLYVLAAALPLIGLARLYRLARAEAAPLRDATRAASGTGVSFDEFDAAAPILIDNLRRRPRAVLADFGFIGVGLVLGTVASIWSLFL